MHIQMQFTLFQWRARVRSDISINYVGAAGSLYQSISDLTQPMNHEIAHKHQTSTPGTPRSTLCD